MSPGVSKPIRYPDTDLGEFCQGNLDQGPYRVFRPQEQLSDDSQPGAVGKEFFAKSLACFGIERILSVHASKEVKNVPVLLAALLANGLLVELKEVDRRNSTLRPRWIGNNTRGSCPSVPNKMVKGLIFARIQQQILAMAVGREAIALSVVAVFATAEEVFPVEHS